MRPFVSTSKAVRQLISRRNGSRRLVRYSGYDSELGNYSQIRVLSSIAGSRVLKGNKDVGSYEDFNWVIQRRGFLGCGDGDEGNVLSKVYEERRILGYVCSNSSFLPIGHPRLD